ncbi:hypothetical protein PGTUg99_015088 [Puccinia graminis f. sp. tritici]|nr:hypothetical protein PGTUg99_015088 [Puccinia graminis f. sp. tritici]
MYSVADRGGDDEEDDESEEDDYVADSRARRNTGIRKKESASAKRKTKKERMKELQGALPDGSDAMKNIVHRHARLLLGVIGTDLKTLPASPTNEERDIAVQRGKSESYNQPNPTAPPSQQSHTQAYKSWIQTQIRTLGLTRFTFDWESSWKHPFNQLMDLLFYRTIYMALHSGEYNNSF